MGILELLDRCVQNELNAAEVYALLAERFAGDDALVTLWSSMAREEREHARKLATWRELLAIEPPEQRPQASGFAEDLAEIEELLARARDGARTADEEEAFALALGIETSEIDAIYTTLLHSSPLARFPDLAETVRREATAHHEMLFAAAEKRCRGDRARLRMALLAARDH